MASIVRALKAADPPHAKWWEGLDIAASPSRRLGVGSAPMPRYSNFARQAYQHHINPAQAQQTQKSANRKNRNVLRPMEGVEYEKLSAPTLEQGAAASASLQSRYASGNDLRIGINALISDLHWSVRADAFEQAWKDLADLLGFAGQRPERDTGRGPDDLWALTDGSFLVTEAKNEVKESHPVYKKHAEQLSNAMDWFRQTYGTNATAVPVLIHARAMFDRKAAVPTGCRVVTEEKLRALRDALHALVVTRSERRGDVRHRSYGAVTSADE